MRSNGSEGGIAYLGVTLRAPTWLAGALFRLEVFGSNHASATKVSSLSITSASPATIRICDFHR
jgi:hypothetical protein